MKTLDRTVNEQDKQQYGSQWKAYSGNTKAKEVRGQRSGGVGGLVWMSLSDSRPETPNSEVWEHLESSWVKRVRPPWWPGSLTKEARERPSFHPPCEDIARRCQRVGLSQTLSTPQQGLPASRNAGNELLLFQSSPETTDKQCLAQPWTSEAAANRVTRCYLLCRMVVPGCDCYTAAICLSLPLPHIQLGLF